MRMFSMSSAKTNKVWTKIENRAKAAFTLAATVSCMAISNSAMAQNTAPVVNDFNLTALEDNPLHVLSNLPAGIFTDADGDTMTALKVVTAPLNGTLYYNGGASTISDGDTIARSLISDLYYVPAHNYEGSDSFVWNGTDGQDFATSNANAYITVTPQNDPPTGISFTAVNIDENLPANSTVGFLTADDPDFGDTHTFALIAGAGDQDNGSFNIVANKLQAVSSFNYEVQNIYHIRLLVTDSVGQNWEGTYGITVNDVNDKPVVADISKQVTQGNNVVIGSTDFSGAYTDEDSNAIDGIRISSLPSIGSLTLSGNPVNINDYIAVANLDNLTYNAPSNFAGTVSFDYYGGDGTDESDNTGKVEIEVKNTRIGSGSSMGSNLPSITSFDTGSGAVRGSVVGPYTGYVPGNGTTNGSGATRPGSGGGNLNQGQGSNKTQDPNASIAGFENPLEFMVFNNYPNPFSGTTAITYELPADYNVLIKVYNNLGTEVATLADGAQSAGVQTITWEPNGDISNGQYFYNIVIFDNEGNQMAVKAGVMVRLK